MKKKKPTIPSIIKWVIALILVVMQVYPFFYVFTSSFKSLDDFRQLPAYALPSKWVQFPLNYTIYLLNHSSYPPGLYILHNKTILSLTHFLPKSNHMFYDLIVFNGNLMGRNLFLP